MGERYGSSEVYCPYACAAQVDEVGEPCILNECLVKFGIVRVGLSWPAVEEHSRHVQTLAGRDFRRVYDGKDIGSIRMAASVPAYLRFFSERAVGVSAGAAAAVHLIRIEAKMAFPGNSLAGNRRPRAGMTRDALTGGHHARARLGETRREGDESFAAAWEAATSCLRSDGAACQCRVQRQGQASVRVVQDNRVRKKMAASAAAKGRPHARWKQQRGRGGGRQAESCRLLAAVEGTCDRHVERCTSPPPPHRPCTPS